MNTKTIAVLGAGNIGTAMARSLLRGGVHVRVYNRSVKRLQAFADANPGAECTTDINAAVAGAGMVLVCVEGHAAPDVLRTVASVTPVGDILIGSCAAATTLAQMQEYCPGAKAWFRLLPNIAATLGASANLLCSAGLTTDEEKALAETFRHTGSTTVVEEHLFPAAMALSSCGIAFALRYLRATMLAGVQAGLTADDSKQLTAAVFNGVTALLGEGEHPDALVDRVCTPGGVTIRGVNAMERGGLTAAVIDGILATLSK